jgi:hypothetical protein
MWETLVFMKIFVNSKGCNFPYSGKNWTKVVLLTFHKNKIYYVLKALTFTKAEILNCWEREVIEKLRVLTFWKAESINYQKC